MRTSGVILSILLISILAFSGVVHAFVPHNHSNDSGASILVHSALRHEEQDFFMLAPLALISVAIVVVATGLSKLQLVLLHIKVRTHSSELSALRRGILAYRRFT